MKRISRWLKTDLPRWRWDQLRSIGNSRMARMTAFIPLLAYVLSYIEPLHQWINQYISADLYRHLWMTFLFFCGLLLIAGGSLLFQTFAPHQVVRHASDVEYFEAEHAAWWVGEYGSVYKNELQGTPYQPNDQYDKVEVIRNYYRCLCVRRPVVRLAISVLYATGLACVSLPIVVRIIHVLSSFFGQVVA